MCGKWYIKSGDNMADNLISEMWKRNKIKLSQVLKRNEPTKYGSEMLWNFQYNQLIRPNVDKGYIINDVNYEE